MFLSKQNIMKQTVGNDYIRDEGDMEIGDIQQLLEAMLQNSKYILDNTPAM